LDTKKIIKECLFKAVRSSGAGGQHVNKVSSKVELNFNVIDSEGITGNEKNILKQKLKLTKEGFLILQCSETRSQHKNKEIVTKHFLKLLKKNLIIPKKRIVGKIPHKVIRKRLEQKNKQALKKNNRKKPNID
jgi:ribosome-associated protein